MPNYIDVDKVRAGMDELRKSPWFTDEYLTSNRLAKKDAFGVIEDLVLKPEPVIKSTPAERGHWIFYQDKNTGKLKSVICSVCHNDFAVIEIDNDLVIAVSKEDLIYCPVCGSRMDDEVEVRY